jgi:transposase
MATPNGIAYPKHTRINVAALHRAGMTNREIAKSLGMAHTTVSRIVRRVATHGVEPPPHPGNNTRKLTQNDAACLAAFKRARPTAYGYETQRVLQLMTNKLVSQATISRELTKRMGFKFRVCRYQSGKRDPVARARFYGMPRPVGILGVDPFDIVSVSEPLPSVCPSIHFRRILKHAHVAAIPPRGCWSTVQWLHAPIVGSRFKPQFSNITRATACCLHRLTSRLIGSRDPTARTVISRADGGRASPGTAAKMARRSTCCSRCHPEKASWRTSFSRGA